MQSFQPISELEYLQYKTLKGMLPFTQYHFKKRHGRGFVVGDHHVTISDALDRVLTGQLKRLIINIAPRYGKTELAVKNLMAKGLAQNPKARFIHLSYSDDLALDNSEEVRDFVQSEEYRELYPNVEIKPDSKAKKKWYTTEGGGVYATAAAGQVTGFGAGQVDEDDDFSEFLSGLEANYDEIEALFSFGGAIVIDDPIKPEDADSDTQRERVNNRFDSTIRNRVNSRNTPIIIIMQRLHPFDLCGYLIGLEPEEWEVISLPCIYFDGGERKPLWPFKHTLQELDELKKINSIVFERQYLQNPKPVEGLLFAEEELKFYDPAQIDTSKAEFVFIPIDPADQGGDYYAAPVMCIIEDKVYVPEILFNTLGTEATEPETVRLLVRYKTNAARFEGNGGWVSMGKAIRSKIEESLPDIDYRIIKATTNKETRMLAWAAWVKRNVYFRKDYKNDRQYNDFMVNLTNYMIAGKNKHDDAPDVITQGAEYLDTHFSHLW